MRRQTISSSWKNQ